MVGGYEKLTQCQTFFPLLSFSSFFPLAEPCLHLASNREHMS